MNAHASVASNQAQSVAELTAQWPVIRKVWKSAMFGAFATVGADGWPSITPIGSVYLHPTEPRGYYHPVLTVRMPKHFVEQPRFELLFVSVNPAKWLSGLVRGRFDAPIAVRLRGRAMGPRRAINAEEAARWERMTRAVRWTRGYELLWKDVRFVQELTFERQVPVRLGAMRNG